MDDEAPLGDACRADFIQLVTVHESAESVMSRLSNLLQASVDAGAVRFSGQDGEVSFFNFDILEEDTAQYTVMGADTLSDSLAQFSTCPSISEDTFTKWFPNHASNGFPEFALDALRILNEAGADGGGCFTFSKPDPWGMEGYVVG